MRATDENWFMDPWPGVLIRIARPGQPPRLIRAAEDQLQAVMDKAAREFHDPTRPPTRPIDEKYFQPAPAEIVRAVVARPKSEAPKRKREQQPEPWWQDQ